MVDQDYRSFTEKAISTIDGLRDELQAMATRLEEDCKQKARELVGYLNGVAGTIELQYGSKK
jgi:hypothetical protein